MAGMFGCLVSGRLVQTSPQVVSENQVVFPITDCETINHLVVFLTGASPFPDGIGGSVYFCWPKPTPSWHYLGFISNQKPSAIFKISKTKPLNEVSNPFDCQQNISQAQLGINAIPMNDIQQLTPATNTTAANLSQFVEFTQKMIKNVYNYASSFGITQSQMTNQPNEIYIPLNSITQWYHNFERRMNMDPNFWKDLT